MRRPARLQAARDAGERSAGADEVAERVDPPPACAQISGPVCRRGGDVAGQPELVGAERPAFAASSCARRPRRARGRRRRPGRRATRRLIDEHHLGAERAHHLRALGAVALGHHRDERVALHGAHDRQTRARVAARELDDRLAGLQGPPGLGVLDHRSAMRSFLEQPGLRYSSLASTRPARPAAAG